ncbi:MULTISPECIES: hypothetical protein [Pseudomonas syringae group]|uniref:hypothetical protein n=1 Tax=Pseudomonas syringae group TaxID=136849 RepID=UPI0010684F06|nr:MULTISPECIES: hypothetical protein [Pseudomonas syringae group]MBI6847404.1 hypothetical protein [Pseudomonas syringae]MBX6509449.1 hypothetical protein [Pseudomonas syringae pv. tomato]TES58924.1 hypothetical protein E2N91_11815 [Pseudomonas syringae pv. tomato]TES79752.1 hypothetical protein E2N89_05980 [Pseudomonas syringae pv. tomato]
MNSSASEIDRNTRALPLLDSRRVSGIGRQIRLRTFRGFAILALQPAWARSDQSPMRPGQRSSVPSVRAVLVRLTLALVVQSLLELDELLSLDEQLELSLELL